MEIVARPTSDECAIAVMLGAAHGRDTFANGGVAYKNQSWVTGEVNRLLDDSSVATAHIGGDAMAYFDMRAAANPEFAKAREEERAALRDKASGK